MSWLFHHEESERHATLAEIAATRGEGVRALELYELAANAELSALRAIEGGKKRTIAITAISVVSLYFKAKEFRKAESIAHQWLASDDLPAFAVKDLRRLIQQIWTEDALRESGIEFTKGEVLIRVQGRDVVVGGAPLELIQQKVSEVSKIFYRVVEMLLDLPLRKRGEPTAEIQQQCRPWLFQAPATSYQFAVKVQQPIQPTLFPDGIPRVEQIVDKFLAVVRAASNDPENQLPQVVPDAAYRAVVLKLVRNLAPTSKSGFGKLEIRSVDQPTKPIVFTPSQREAINESIKTEKRLTRPMQATEEEKLTGVLKGLQLNQDWIDLVIPDEGREIRIHDAGEMIDDIIGPMVNHRVIVDTVRLSSGKYVFRDIQLEE